MVFGIRTNRLSAAHERERERENQKCFNLITKLSCLPLKTKWIYWLDSNNPWLSQNLWSFESLKTKCCDQHSSESVAWHRPFKILHFLIFLLAAIVIVRLIHLSHLHEFTFLKFIASKWMLLPNWVDKSGCRRCCFFCFIHSIEVWDRRQERVVQRGKKDTVKCNRKVRTNLSRKDA